MELKFYLKQHLSHHPSARAQDVLKLCYQRAFGAEHLLLNLDAARTYFFKEYEAIPAREGDAVEPISDALARVHFAQWKQAGGDPEALFSAFAASAQVSGGGEALFVQELEEVSACLVELNLGELQKEWDALLEAYDVKNPMPVHHSKDFRQAEAPAYRLVKRCFLTDILPN